MRYLITIFLISLPAWAQTQRCDDKVQDLKNEREKLQQLYDQGRATLIELTNAKLELSQEQFDCGLTARPDYCKYQIDLMRFKRDLLEDSARNGETAGEDLDTVGATLERLEEFCR